MTGEDAATPRPDLGRHRAGEPRWTDRRLRLYVAGSTPNSVRAADNLNAVIADGHPDLEHMVLEIIDVFQHPMRALKEGILVTPTLVALRREARLVIVGDLVDRVQLRMALTAFAAV